MTASVDCPVCGRTFTRPTEEQARASARSHMQSKTDSDHKGIGWEKANQMLSIEAAGSQDIPGSQAGPDGAMAPPSFEEPETEEVEEVDAEELEADPTCPECGSEEIEDMAGRIAEKNPDLADDYDHVCLDCKEVF